MIELLEQDLYGTDRQSSKGNQMKWRKKNRWYKGDYTGYEGLVEYVISKLLEKSTLPKERFVLYQTEQIKYKYNTYLGCSSENFLPKGWQMITLERLFQNRYGKSLNQSIYSITDVKERVSFVVNQVTHMTGLQDFGPYIRNLMTVDALFLNEDRHTHNIAVLVNAEGEYHYCPVFDHGGCLLSDTKLDYPLGADIFTLIRSVKAKTFHEDFDEQMNAAEELYGQGVKFSFTTKDVESILEKEEFYPLEIKQRVKEIICEQMRKYGYLFINN